MFLIEFHSDVDHSVTITKESDENNNEGKSIVYTYVICIQLLPYTSDIVIPPANEVAGVYSDPYVRPFLRPSVRPSPPNL